MRFPQTFCYVHFGKYRLKGPFPRRASHQSKVDLSASFLQMENTHLVKTDSIKGIFKAKIAFPAAQTVIHTGNRRRNLRCGPIGVAPVGYHASKPGLFCIMILNTSLGPAAAVLINCQTALIKQGAALKAGFDGKREIRFFRAV